MHRGTLISLRTGDGRHVGLNPAGDATLVAGDAPAEVFERIELEAGGIALRSLSSGWYLSAGTQLGLAAVAQVIGPPQTFVEIGDAGGPVALHLVDGTQCLAVGTGAAAPVTARAVSAGPAEVFLVEPVAVQEPDHVGCCGPAVPHSHAAPGGRWKRDTHWAIVEKAVDLLRNPELKLTEATELIKIWDAKQGFHEFLSEGLADADEKSPWTGTTCAVFWKMFEGHFYDPDTKGNYIGPTSRPNAMNLGRLCFNYAVHFGRRIYRLRQQALTPPNYLYERAGHWLGLSLHFLTDLTQPMHAANFTNGFGEEYRWSCDRAHRDDLRHAGFEEYTDSVVKEYFANYPPLRREDLDLASIVDVGSHLHDVAVGSKKVFVDPMRKVCRDKVKWENGRVVGYVKEWQKAEADPALKLSLASAPRVVARYMAYWTRCVMGTPGIDVSRWYRIKDARGWSVRLRNRHFILTSEGGGDDALFYFLVNPDGTFSMACRGWKANLWMLAWDDWTPRWVVSEHKNASGERQAASKFMIVSGPGGKVWFLDTLHLQHSFSGAIGFLSDDNLQRTHSDDPETYSAASRQLFTLEAGDTIGVEDRDAIREHFRDFGTRHWWGDNVS